MRSTTEQAAGDDHARIGDGLTISVFSEIPNFAMSEVYKALADPTRRRILELLRAREMTAGELADHFALAKPTLSGHFAVLRQADLIVAEKAGTTITYRLNLSVLEDALLALMKGFGLLQPAARTTGPPSNFKESET
jgi:DNA-binding transcriptional ArsR family regulator